MHDARSVTRYVGRSVRRREDARLLQGRGAYVADVQRPHALHLAVVRSRACVRSRMARAAFAQPVRGRRVAWMMSRPGSACNSTSSGSCA